MTWLDFDISQARKVLSKLVPVDTTKKIELAIAMLIDVANKVNQYLERAFHASSCKSYVLPSC
jgi:CheY-specific phosphatase CheX